MVDTGATSHIVTDIGKFKEFDETFKLEKHSVELADGTRTNGVAERRGAAEVYLRDNTGRRVKTTLTKVLYVPSFPQDIFSVKAATANGASVNFRQGCNKLIHKNGTTFDIEEYDRLYYLNTQLVIGKSTGEFNAVRARKHLERITSFGPRPTGSPENEVLTVNFLLEQIEHIKADSASGPHSVTVDVQRPTGSFSIDFLGGFTSYYDRVSNIAVRPGAQGWGSAPHAGQLPL
ncbi:hypothetical protein J4Q44_G00075960 [Coregonus suidteri]|uniref:Retrovirus-related Pol polyprotein from transposon TNT 1-94-like beta-barrel domain-containing protein n=1 Tax=Coregonus suidteri TaxID=861788 RepID=A0AAN8R3J0_9TELE